MGVWRSRAGKLPIIIVIVGALLLVALGGVAFMKFKGGSTKHGKDKHEPVATVTMDLGEMVVNLADSKEPHYLKTKIVLEVAGGAAPAGGGHGGHGGGGDEVSPKMRDAVITALSARTFGELLTPEGKKALKESIKTAVNKTLPEGKVTDVFFSDFAMQ